jgi:DHA2 family lincomycin resistance protein-like MFS transporter
MSTGLAEPPLLTGAARWTVVFTLLLSALAYTVSTRGTVLQTNQITQAFDLDRYKVQWITGPEGVVGLTAIFASIYFLRVFGPRRMYIAGAACLGLGALGTTLASNGWQAGVAGVVRSCAGLYAIPGLTLLQQLTPRRKALAMSIYLAMVYGGQVVAEPLGGLVDFHPSWRTMFAVIAVCSGWFVLCALCLLPDDRPAHKPDKPFDWLGAILFAAGLGLCFFIFYRGNYLGWLVSTPICIALVAFGVVTGLYIWRELVAPEPFMSLSGFTYRTVCLTMLAAAFWGASMYGMAIQLPHYLVLRGYEHWKTGWVTLPMSLVLTATMVLGAFIVKRTWMVWTLRLGLAGMTVLGFWLSRVDLYTSWQWLMAVTMGWGFCAGICLPVIARLVYEGQPAEQVATTGAMKFFMRAFGGTVGILLAGVFLDQAATWGLDYVRTSMTLGQGALQVTEPAILNHMVRRGSAPPEAAAQTEALIGYWVNLHAQIIGYRAALHLCARASAVGLAISCFISRKKEISVLDAG